MAADACSLAQIVDSRLARKIQPPRHWRWGSSGSVQVTPKEDAAPRKVRYISHITLSVSRLWTSPEGKLVEGKLIAFEDMTVEGVQGATPTTAPEPPKYPTVTRDEKIRLLVNQKPVETPAQPPQPGRSGICRASQSRLRKKIAVEP